MRTLSACAALLLSGGAVPGATFGGTGVHGASVNYVAIPSWGGSTIQVVDDGEVDRWRNFSAPTAYRSRPTTARRRPACRRTSGRSCCPRSRTTTRRDASRMVVLNPFDLRPRTTLSLPGAYTVHALSPDGRFIYLIRYTAPIRDIDRHELTVYDLETRARPSRSSGPSARRSRARPRGRSPGVHAVRPQRAVHPRARHREPDARGAIALPGLGPPTSTSMRLMLDGEHAGVARQSPSSARTRASVDTRTLAPIRFGPAACAASALPSQHDRPAARLLRAPARRGRPRGRRGHRPRARAPAAHAGDDRLGELRAAGRARVPGQRAHEQVRRGLSGQALLRRLRVHRRHRAARDRPREGAVRGRARERPAARRRAGQHGRLPRAAAAGRPHHGPVAAARRPPHATA